MANQALFDRLRDLVVELKADETRAAAEEALERGASPQDIISLGLSKGMEIVGERFERREYFLPELMFSARVMKSVLELLRPLLAQGADESATNIVLGTVQGDVHYIGKNIVGAVLEGDGYTVFDLGEDVPPEEFVKKAVEVDADVVGVSALISAAVSKMAETIAVLKENNVSARIIVGGAAVTSGSAENLGADAYGADAWAALRQVRRLIKEGG
jgi:5-methyltetrahydrofolate--homocysteine methyltransferase